MKDGQIWRRRRRKMDTSGEYGYENQTWYKVRVKGDVLALVRFKPGDDPQTPRMGYEADQNKTDFKMEDYERVSDNDIATAEKYMKNLDRSLEEQRGSKSREGEFEEEAEPAAKEDPYHWVSVEDVPAMKTERNTRVKVSFTRNGGNIRASNFFMGKITDIHEEDGGFSFDVDYDDKTTNPTTEARVPMQWVQVRKPQGSVYTFDTKPAEGGAGSSVTGAVVGALGSAIQKSGTAVDSTVAGTESKETEETEGTIASAPTVDPPNLSSEAMKTAGGAYNNDVLKGSTANKPSAPPVESYAERAAAGAKAAEAQRKRETKQKEAKEEAKDKAISEKLYGFYDELVSIGKQVRTIYGDAMNTEKVDALDQCMREVEKHMKQREDVYKKAQELLRDGVPLDDRYGVFSQSRIALGRLNEIYGSRDWKREQLKEIKTKLQVATTKAAKKAEAKTPNTLTAEQTSVYETLKNMTDFQFEARVKGAGGTFTANVQAVVFIGSEGTTHKFTDGEKVFEYTWNKKNKRGKATKKTKNGPPFPLPPSLEGRNIKQIEGNWKAGPINRMFRALLFKVTEATEAVKKK